MLALSFFVWGVTVLWVCYYTFAIVWVMHKGHGIVISLYGAAITAILLLASFSLIVGT